MKRYEKSLAIATAVLALPLFTFGQTATNSSGNSTYSQSTGQHEATRMVPANAALLRTINAKDVAPGYQFKAKLSRAAKLDDGTKLPAGTVLLGKVEQDDMQLQGTSKLALRFDQAVLKDGKIIPIKATIVGVYPPQAVNAEDYPVVAGNQVPNGWNDGTLQVDQINALPGVDLHSKIKSQNSGVFVSTKKDEVKLNTGSEFQLAITDQTRNTSSGS